MKLNHAILLSSLLTLVGCNATKDGAFGSLETTPSTSSDATAHVYEAVHINSFTPTIDPLVITAASSTVFGVVVPGDVGTMDYNYLLDGTTVLQDGTNPFFTLSGSSLSAGSHDLKVIARNSSTSDEKTFRLRKNTPTSIVSYTPALSGASVACGTGSITFTGIMSDLDSDPFTAIWDIDNSNVTPSTPFAAVTTINPFSQLVYTPDCSKLGSHILSLKIYDGYEVSTKTWTFTVTTPPSAPGSVQILSFSPTVSPVVLTNTKTATFGVTIADGAGSVDYEFLKDGSTSLQSGATSFYTLDGATLTAGYHSIKVVASNASTHDEKIFNVRKNTPPAFQISSPALTGNTMSCSGDTLTFQSTYTDTDTDTVLPTWKIDEQLVGASTPFAVVTNVGGLAKLIYTPDCTKSGPHTFRLTLDDGYETTSQVWSLVVSNPPALPGALSIQTFTPTVDPVVLTNSSATTFAVTVPDGTGAVSYEFKKDATVIQTSSSPFYSLSGSSLTSGAHILKVKATNSVSSVEKSFNVRKNTPSAVVSYSPALSGTQVTCGTGTVTFNAIMSDADSDPFSISWELDNATVTPSTAYAAVSTTSPISQLVYSPDCTQNGAHNLVLKINDGYETTTKTWSFSVSNPPIIPGAVQITSFSPTTTPVILTAANSVTFGVTVADGSGTIAYTFSKDNTDTLQTGSTSFFSLNGSSLTPGNHSIKVHAANSSTFDEKIFNVRKNTPPTTNTFSPAYSGNIMSCSGDSITLQSSFSDYDTDTLTASWKLDDVAVTGSTPFTVVTSSTGTSRVVYTPDCTKSGVHAFKLTVSDGYETTVQNWTVTVSNPPAPPGSISIQTFTPTINPVVMTNSTSNTFAVSVPDGTGAVTYEFKQDSNTVLQSSSVPFYILNGTSLSSGLHTLKVKATNSVSSDEKTFNIRKNTPTSVASFSPAATGTVINCGGGSTTFNATMNDVDNDTFSMSWELDNALVTPSTSYAVVTTNNPISQLVYTPDCTQNGAHNLVLKINDGYETTIKTWTFSVSNPPTPLGAVSITSFSPTVSPVILTAFNSMTFGVTVADGSGTISYSFTKDNFDVLQTGATSFYTLGGAALTPGYHSIRVRAANSTTYDEKVFNVRKNTPPTAASYSPTYTGNSMNCSGDSITMQSAFSDYDSDAITASWKVDDALATPSTPFSVITTATGTSKLVYTPDCTKAGVHSFQLNLTDGYEITTQTWTVTVNNPPAPPGSISIQTFTPTVTPVVMTDSTSNTFAVSVPDGTGVVTYEFKKDYATVLQSSTTPFFILNGSSLTPGLHTLKVKATNSVSFDEKVFNVRKNTPTTVSSFTPASAGSTVNCGSGSLTFSAIMNDVDNDSFSMGWELDSTTVSGTTPMTAVTATSTSTQLVYTPDCTKSGYHTLVLKINDGYELTTKSWTFNVINPTVEAIASYYPFSNSIYALSTDTAKTFTASGTGIGALTFKWKVDGTVVQTDTNSSSSTLNLLMSSIAVGTHTIQVVLTDSTTSNDPTVPAAQSWSIYKNAKPRFVSYSPATGTKLNILSTIPITASIEDALDTFTVSIVKGATACTTPANCGLSGVVSPTATGSYSATFTPTTAFLGDNTYTMTVLDSHGESTSQDIQITVNYFTDACNNLAKGGICTLVGLPGLGSNTNTLTNASKIRINPAWMTLDDLGNWFFSDHSTHTVWYYNTLSTSVTLLGVTIPAKTIYVVAGTGVAAQGSGGNAARKVGLNFSTYGGGVAWDSDRKELYIADYANNRVVKVASDGRANVVCGGGALTTQGALAKDSKCSNPVDVEFDVTNRRLYVSQQADHVIKYIDASGTSYTTWPSYVLAGAYATQATTAGTTNLSGFPGTTIAGTSRLAQPWGLSLDTTDQILYFTEWSNCRVRALGLPTGVSRSIGGQSITANNVAIITSGTCANSAVNTDTAINSMTFRSVYDLIHHKVSGGLAGIFVNDGIGNKVVYLNNSAGAVGIGNQTIASGMANNIFGNGTANPTNPPSGKTAAVVTPVGIGKSGTSLYVGIKGSSIIRSIDLSVTSGTPVNVIGGTPRAGYSGNTPSDSRLVTLNNPLSLLYRESSNLIYISDSSNYMIRTVNLSSGIVQDFIGTGASGNETLLNTVTTSTRITGAKSMAFIDDFFLYTDFSNNCFVRAFNPYNSDQTVFSSLVNQNRTSVVAGYANTCGAFVGTTGLNTSNTNAKLDNPYGIGVDQSSRTMYVASQNSHCILKVTDNGTMTPFIGTCGTAGTSGSPVYGGAYNDPALLLRNPTEIWMDTTAGYEGNFFFVDHTDTTKSHVKYVNLVSNSAVPFPGGITVAKNNVETVFAGSSSPGYLKAVAGMEDWLCYTSGSPGSNLGSNVVVCRNRVTSASYTFGVSGEGGISPEGSDEGAIATDIAATVSLAIPSGLTFDKSGNLYISEMNGHVIRMIKKWW
jgi:hypothetical protein